VKKVYQSTPSGGKSAAKTKYRQQKTAKNHRVKTLVAGLGLFGLSIVSAAAGALLAVTLSNSSPLQQAALTPEEQKVFSQEETVAARSLNIPKLSRPVNILLLGIKTLESEAKQQNTANSVEKLGYHALANSFDGLSDSMLLLRFDPERESLAVLSIPRDTRVRIEGYGINKINQANELGGPALTAASVSKLLDGVNIDRYIRVNVQGVEKLIDALGGVNVYVPKDMKYNDFSQHLYINLKKGQQHLNGDKAIQFLRFRYDAYGDISRVQRQQMLIRAAVEQTLKPGTIVKIPQILKVIQSHIDTNLTVKELMALANFASKTDRSDVEMMMLPGDFSSYTQYTLSYWLPNEERIQKLVAQHFGITPLEELPDNSGSNGEYLDWEAREARRKARLSIAIQDSQENSEAANAMLTALQKAGYSRAYISNGWHEPLKETRIVAQSGDKLAATSLRTELGVGDVLVESTGVLNSDLTIQIGVDWQKYVELDRQLN
jgi:polyisoprenyl-teichoic acid--peptidoglycan teichoic acid transferase